MMCEHKQDGIFIRFSGAIYDQGGTNSTQVETVNLVNPQSEWNLVMRGEATYIIEENLTLTNHVPIIKNRDTSTNLQKLINRARRECPDLVKAEIIALRLWTGPMHKRYVSLLRSIFDSGPNSPYVTTIHAFNSGIVKLSRHQKPTAVLYRGFQLSSAGLPAHIDGVEVCVLATSKNRDVAEEFSRGGLVLRLEPACSRCAAAGRESTGGADVSWLSQFPEQEEVLFPALSRLEGIGAPRPRESGGWEWAVRIVPSKSSKTLEDFGRPGFVSPG